MASGAFPSFLDTPMGEEGIPSIKGSATTGVLAKIFNARRAAKPITPRALGMLGHEQASGFR